MKYCKVWLWGLIVWLASAHALANGQLEIRVIDHDTGQPIAVRMHLKNAQGRAIKPPGAPTLGDHFVFSDKIMLRLPNGGYEFLVERGGEYLEQRGHFEIQNFADDNKAIEMRRFVDMAKDGWFSGDLDVERPDKDVQLLMQADDVHVVPAITWSFKKNPWTKQPLPKSAVSQFDGSFFESLLGGELTTPGTTLRLFRLNRPLGFTGQQGDLATSVSQLEKPNLALGSVPLIPLVEQARQQQHAWIDAGAFFARDLPIWIAAGQIDSVQLANRHLEREGVVDNEAGGWQRDTALFPKPNGNGRWSQEIYYHLLNCGLRIPPTAGSGSGANNNPVGYNRMYVHVADSVSTAPAPNFSADESAAKSVPVAQNSDISWDGWWNALRAGRVSVTNGPLIRPNVQGHLPGYVFKADPGKPLELMIGLTLSTRDKIRYLDVVQNGRIASEASLDDYKQAGGKLAPLTFNESGWFVVRVVGENAQTYRFATTAPYYVEFGYQPRISRKSAQFFLDWTSKRAEEISAAAKTDNSAVAQIAVKYAEQAKSYWQTLVDKANAE
ncbi:MAG TPA: hypothetical protein VGJ15_09050 [Pirellulales bacterium]|jgi:hypothetical protein